MYNECSTQPIASTNQKQPAVSESLGNLNSLICDIEKSMAEVWQRLTPIRRCQPVEARKDVAVPNKGIPVVDEIERQVRRLYELNKGIIALLQEIEV